MLFETGPSIETQDCCSLSLRTIITDIYVYVHISPQKYYAFLPSNNSHTKELSTRQAWYSHTHRYICYQHAISYSQDHTLQYYV